MHRDEILRRIANQESLAWANLGGANLYEANLYEANLGGADLRGADLRGADLRGADLRGADLRGADLRGADLRRANLYEANLRRANLRRANLYEANLGGADLREADLREADLREADLREADLREADLGDEQSRTRRYIEAITLVPPEVGAFQAWKSLANGHLALLLVPEDASRCSATSRKCRVSRATVLKIFDRLGNEVMGPIPSRHDPTFRYMVGITVEPTMPFDTDRWNECSSGIHCFLTRYEAETY